MEVSAKLNQDNCVNEAFHELFSEILTNMDSSKIMRNKEGTIFRNQT